MFKSKKFWGLILIIFSFISISLIPNIAECFIWAMDGGLTLLISVVLFLVGLFVFILGVRSRGLRIAGWITLILIVLLIGITISNLDTARQKATAAATQATMAGMRTQAEMMVTVGQNPDDYYFPENLCDQNSGPWSEQFKAMHNYGANNISCFKTGDSKDWAVSAGLPMTGKIRKSLICKSPLFDNRIGKSKEIWCVDSTGFAGKVPSNITGPSCGNI